MTLTTAQKQARRMTELDAIAQAAGWDTWTRYATAVKRGVVSIATNPKNQRRTMSSKLLRIQIRDADGSDTYRAVKIYNDAEVEVKHDYGTIGEAARDNLDKGVKVYRGKKEITCTYAESGEIG